uniref:Uncharacterized protein n=1 Tax=Anguilla anguilla TaxID=7936 RepID=A0A0E9VH26_ANGAN
MSKHAPSISTSLDVYIPSIFELVFTGLPILKARAKWQH